MIVSNAYWNSSASRGETSVASWRRQSAPDLFPIPCPKHSGEEWRLLGGVGKFGCARGDLTNRQWEQLRPLPPPQNRRSADPLSTLGGSSRGRSRSCTSGRPGVIRLSAMSPGIWWPVVSSAGGRLGSPADPGYLANRCHRPCELGSQLYR
jgi:hypothetical protein